MKKLILSILSCTFLFACSSKKDLPSIALSGSITNPLDGEMVKLERILNDQLEVVDSFYLDTENKFLVDVEISEPAFYRLNLFGRRYVNLILNDTDVTVTADAVDRGTPAVITGSVDTDYILELSKLQSSFERSVNNLNSSFMQARGNGDDESIRKIQNEYLRQKAQSDKQVKETIWNMDNSVAGILALQYLSIDEHFAFYDSMATKYKEVLPASTYTKDLSATVENVRKLAIGSPAPEINLPSPSGTPVALSSLKGKYVMIDFWAAWCRPCRMENPNIVRMYEKYNGMGFEVYGVSLDRTKDAWLKAIADDGLTWTQVSDLKYFESEAAATYNITSIPATYLIGPDGSIIAKGLRGAELEAKLQEIFS